MLLRNRLNLRGIKQISQPLSYRSSSHGQPLPPRSRYARSLAVLAGVSGSGLALSLLVPTAMADADQHLSSPGIQQLSTLTLIRSYLVYTLCTFPTLIDNSPSILQTLTHSPIPGLKTITEYIIRHTFFAQFVPGESVKECMEEMKSLRKRGMGSVLNYSAEAEVEEGGDYEKLRRVLEERRLREVELALDQAGEFEEMIAGEGESKGSSAFALKITGLIDPAILQRASTTLLRLRPLTTSNSPSSPFSSPSNKVPYPGTPQSSDAQIVSPQTRPSKGLNKTAKWLMTLKGAVSDMGVLESDEGLREGDFEELEIVWEKVRGLAKRAKTRGIKLMIDAEHTWYQPALDAFTLLLSEEFNKPPSKKAIASGEKWNGPLIFGTYQSYLTRQPGHLKAALTHAEKNGYALGVKLVRGAYFVQERQKWKDEKRDGPDPIWSDKPSTDLAYNNSIKIIISTLSTQLSSPTPELSLSVVFGTHNDESCDLILESLQRSGLASPSSNEEGGKLKLRDDVKGKVFVAQLYGMKDDLTDRMAESFEYTGMPVALKYIAYGTLSEVMPFLGRRAIENKSMMSGEGGAAAETKRIGKELKRRVFG